MSSSLADLFAAKFGKPPYQLDDVEWLRNECRTLVGALEAGHTVERDSALTMFELMEHMAYFMSFHSRDVFPSALYSSENQSLSDDVPHEILASLEPLVRETLQCRDRVIELLELPQSSGGICKTCNWTMARMLRSKTLSESTSRPNERTPKISKVAYHHAGTFVWNPPSFFNASSQNLQRVLLRQFFWDDLDDLSSEIQHCKLCCFVKDYVSQRHQPDSSESFSVWNIEISQGCYSLSSESFVVWISPFWNLFDGNKLDGVNVMVRSMSEERSSQLEDLAFFAETSDGKLTSYHDFLLS